MNLKKKKKKKRKEIKVNVIKDVKNIFRLKNKTDHITCRDTRFDFRLVKENEAIKDRIVRDIRHLFEHEEKDCDKPVRV